MIVSLKWMTPDAERVIVECARVSTTMDSDRNDARLLRYLIEHKHWSPFEMASACFYIECDRAVGRQILRHRSFSFQEFSQRYAEPAFNTTLPFRRDAETNRQSSVEVPIEPWRDNAWRQIQDDAKMAYVRARELGVAKEVARAVLPEGLTQSRMFMSGTIRSWLHYVDLRTKPDTQAEHRSVACHVAGVLMELMPNVMSAMIVSDL